MSIIINKPGRPVPTRRIHAAMSMKQLIIATMSMVILLGSGAAPAEKIYKWTDAEGNVHYGSQKPADAPAEKMQVDTGLTGTNTGAEALDKMKQEADDEARRIKEEGIPEQPPVPSLPMKEVKRRCAAAKQDLATIQARGQLKERDEQGNISFVSEEARQQRIKQAQKQIKEYCY
jgi:hypothetical protein